MNTEENLQLAKKLKEYATAYVANLECYKRDSKKRFELFEKATKARLSRLRDSIQSTGENIVRIEHEIHCLCVELGIAKKEDWRYGNQDMGAALGEMYGSIREYRREPGREPKSNSPAAELR